MGKLKQKMAEDLKLRGLCENTRITYLRCAEVFVRHYAKPPAQLGRTDIRDYLLQMLQDRKWKPATYNVHAAALKFLYSNTLERSSCGNPWTAFGRTKSIDSSSPA